jgi:integrase
MSLNLRGKTWHVDVANPHGGRIRRTARTSDRRQAQRFHDELVAELWQVAPQPAPGRIFSDAVAAWLETGPKGMPDRYRLKAFGIHDLALADLDEDRLRTLLARYQGASRNRCINLLHAVLAEAQRRGWIDAVPHMARVKTKESRVRWLTADEWQRLQAELPCHLRNMARFAVATGLREANVIGLEWSQIDVARAVAWIHPDQAKAAKPIGVPLSEDALRVLAAQAEQHERWVFVYGGQPVTKTSTKAWWKALERAELGEWEGKGADRRFVPNFRWHDLRHTWASWHVMNGTPLEVLQKLGGWKTLQMVLRYAHLAPEHLAGWAANSAPVRHTGASQLAGEGLRA